MEVKAPAARVTERVVLLRSVPFLKAVRTDIIGTLAASLHSTSFDAEEAVMIGGALSESLFLVIKGKLREQGGDGTWGPGEVVGELGALTARLVPRSIVAAKRTRALELTRGRVAEMFDDHFEVAWQVLTELCGRLRSVRPGAESSVALPPEAMKPSRRRRASTMESSTLEKVILLKTTSVFAGLDDSGLAEVAAIATETFVEPGDVLFSRGDRGTSMYVLLEGQVEVLDAFSGLAADLGVDEDD